MSRRNSDKMAVIHTLPNVFEHSDNPVANAAISFFGNDNPVVLELGCGRGEYTIALAKKYPEKNFIGVDLKGPRIWKGATTAIAEKLNNVCFLRIRIEDILQYISRQVISEIWVPFPDPFPKKSKSNKRLMSVRFLNLYKKLLLPDGILHFKTDNTPLFDFALETIAEMKLNLLASTYDLYASALADEYTTIPTKYETMFRTEGIEIKYLKMKFPA